MIGQVIYRFLVLISYNPVQFAARYLIEVKMYLSLSCYKGELLGLASRWFNNSC